MNRLSTINSNASSDLLKLTTYQAGVIQASSNRLLQKLCDDVLVAYGISKMQWLIIGTIYDAGAKGIRITDIAEQLDTTQSYITSTVNLLESRLLLSKKDSSTDNRSKLVCVDKSFISKCKEIEAALREALHQTIYDNIDPADFLIYLKVVYQLSTIKPPTRKSAQI